MADDTKKTEIELDKVPEHPRAAAVHTTELWDGPRFVKNAEEKPVWCETKQEYWDLLAKNGFRMLDQAESVAPSGVQQKDAEIPIEFTPAPTPKPFSQGEAHLWGAADAVFKGRGLTVVTFSCNECFVRNKFEWCQCVVQNNLLAVTCHCGTRSYAPPKGTTDTFMSKLPNLALHSEAPSTGTVMIADGSSMPLPVQFLTDQEALILQAFVRNLRSRELEIHVFHPDCFYGDPSDRRNEVGMKISHDDVIILCPCRQLHWRRTRMEEVIH